MRTIQSIAAILDQPNPFYESEVEQLWWQWFGGTTRWKRILDFCASKYFSTPEESVLLKGLVSWQPKLSGSVMRRYASSSEELWPISVMTLGGLTVITDGNHRAAVALQMGQKRIRADRRDGDRIVEIFNKLKRPGWSNQKIAEEVVLWCEAMGDD